MGKSSVKRAGNFHCQVWKETSARPAPGTRTASSFLSTVYRACWHAMDSFERRCPWSSWSNARSLCPCSSAFARTYPSAARSPASRLTWPRHCVVSRHATNNQHIAKFDKENSPRNLLASSLVGSPPNSVCCKSTRRRGCRWVSSQKMRPTSTDER